MLNQLPNTVIVESFTQPTNDELAEIKEWIANDLIVIDLKGQQQKTVPLPNFIFCSNYSAKLNFGKNNRRFKVINLDFEIQKSPSEFKEWVDKKIAAIGG